MYQECIQKDPYSFSHRGNLRSGHHSHRRCEVFNETGVLCNPLWNINKDPSRDVSTEEGEKVSKQLPTLVEGGCHRHTTFKKC
jgi:hypothetical protein